MSSFKYPRLVDGDDDVCATASHPRAPVLDRRRAAAHCLRRGGTGPAAGGAASASGHSCHCGEAGRHARSEEHTSELQSLMRISYAVFFLKKKKSTHITTKSS